jgi:hypothetical protein
MFTGLGFGASRLAVSLGLKVNYDFLLTLNVPSFSLLSHVASFPVSSTTHPPALPEKPSSSRVLSHAPSLIVPFSVLLAFHEASLSHQPIQTKTSLNCCSLSQMNCSKI